MKAQIVLSMLILTSCATPDENTVSGALPLPNQTESQPPAPLQPLASADINVTTAQRNPFKAGADAAIARIRPRLPQLRNIVFSTVSAQKRHAKVVFTDGTTRDLGDIVVEDLQADEPVQGALAVGQALLTKLAELR